MTNKCSEVITYLELLRRIFSKILEDSIEAYHRTPQHISSKPYIERIMHLAQAGVNATLEAKKKMS